MFVAYCKTFFSWLTFDLFFFPWLITVVGGLFAGCLVFPEPGSMRQFGNGVVSDFGAVMLTFVTIPVERYPSF